MKHPICEPSPRRPVPQSSAFPSEPNRSQPLAMPSPHTNDPLHGITLEVMLNKLVAHYGWAELGRIIEIRCFNYDPSIKSSLKFLRKTPWARAKVEELYLWIISPMAQ